MFPHSFVYGKGGERGLSVKSVLARPIYSPGCADEGKRGGNSKKGELPLEFCSLSSKERGKKPKKKKRKEKKRRVCLPALFEKKKRGRDHIFKVEFPSAPASSVDREEGERAGGGAHITHLGYPVGKRKKKKKKEGCKGRQKLGPGLRAAASTRGGEGSSPFSKEKKKKKGRMAWLTKH